ncbi:MAG: cysteine desulfurase [Nanoarchaeota archaeon]|nr:cysteine desulfurase [Nanoarchaeota archaeon]
MRIYMDNGATTKVDERVVKTMIPYFEKEYGNASSLHDFGKAARKAVEDSRKLIAAKIGAVPEELIFTSGGTESDNMALIGAAAANKKKGNHVISTNFEHPAIMNTLKYLKTLGFEVTYLKVDAEGLISLEELRDSITEKTILVSIMHANNEAGTIQPIKEIGKITKDRGVLFHTDAVQSFTKIPINVNKFNIDLMSLSAHKIHGPKGVGALFIRKGIDINPLMFGGKHEFRHRPGTENVPGIVGFAKAVEISNESDVKRMTKIRDYMISEILKIPNSLLNGSRIKRNCNNINVAFKGIEGESILELLNEKGIAVSTGSACASKNLEPSHVLKALKLPDLYIQGAIRLTISRYTTMKEAEYVLKTLKSIVKRLTEMSPYG